MTNRACLFCGAFMALLVATAVSFSQPADEVPRLTVSLTDGSRIIGVTSLKQLPLTSTSLGKLAIPLERVRQVKRDRDQPESVVTLVNGDKLQAAITLTAIDLQTAFGPVKIPMEFMTAMDVRYRPPCGTNCNHALQFDGSQNYVTVPAFNNTTADKTVEFWAKSTGNGGGFYLGSWSNPHDWLLINNTGANQWYVQTAAGNVFVEPVPTEASDGEWHHYALVEQSGTTTIYLDGTKRASGTATLSQTGEFTIGTAKDGHISYRGAIDEVRISNVARHTGKFDPCDPTNFPQDDHTVALWHFDEGQGETATDSSGHDHTGTLTGSPQPTWEAGPACTDYQPAKKPAAK